MTHFYPHFLIVGMMKAGTTSVYEHLASHPQVKESQLKEIHYFTRDFGMPLSLENWGQEYGELLNVQPSDPKGMLYGEASPSYIAVAQRIYQFNPSCKIIIMLRNRLERSVSQYRQYVSFNYRIKNVDYVHHVRDMVGSGRAEELDIVRDSIYEDRIEEFLRIFPPENVILGSFELFRSQPQHFMDRVFQILGIESYQINLGVRGAKTERKEHEEEIRKLIQPCISRHIGGMASIISKYRPVTIQTPDHSLELI